MPDRTAAEVFANKLVTLRLAACVNVLAGCRSIYHWQGKIENSDEVPVLIKTSASKYAELEQTIRTLHPYELPEIIAVPVCSGSAAYLDWIQSECNISGAA